MDNTNRYLFYALLVTSYVLGFWDLLTGNLMPYRILFYLIVWGSYHLAKRYASQNIRLYLSVFLVVLFIAYGLKVNSDVDFHEVIKVFN